MSGPTRNKRSRPSELPYKRPLAKEEPLIPKEPESGLLGSLWKRGISLLTKTNAPLELPSHQASTVPLPSTSSAPQDQPRFNGFSPSPPRKTAEKASIRGGTPHSTLFVAPKHASGASLSRSQSMLDYPSARRDRQTPSLSAFPIDAHNISTAEGSRVFAHPAAPGSASSFASRGPSMSPLASPFMVSSMAGLYLRSPSPDLRHGRSPLNNTFDSRRTNDVSPRIGSPRGQSPFRSANGLRSVSPSMSSVSSPKRPMTWDPRIGFLPANESVDHELPMQEPAMPENEAEKILQALEGMKTPFTAASLIRQIPRSATLPSLDYQSTSYRHSSNPPISPAGRRMQIEEHERAEHMRDRSPGLKLRDKLMQQEARRTASPSRPTRTREYLSSEEEAEQPKRKQRRVKSLSPPVAERRRSPRKHKHEEKSEQEEKKSKSKNKGKSKEKERATRSGSAESKSTKSSKSEGKKKAKKEENRSKEKEPEVVKEKEQSQVRSPSPTRGMFSARDEDMDSDSDDAPIPSTSEKIIMPRTTPLQPFKPPVQRVDMGIQADPIEPTPVIPAVKEVVSEAPKVEEIKSQTEASTAPPAFSFTSSNIGTPAEPAVAKSPFSFAPSASSASSTKPAEPQASVPKLPAAFSFETSAAPAFSFSPASTANPSSSSASPSTTISAVAETQPAPAPKPAFSFGVPAPASSSTEAQKPAFSFGNATKASEAAPAQSAAAPAFSGFSFGNSSASTSEPKAPTPSLDPFKPDATSQPAPTFSFSAATPVSQSTASQPQPDSSPIKSPFNFAMSTPDTKAESGPTPIDLSPPAATPSFSSSGPLSPVEPPASKPAFNFAAPSTSSTQPAFTFGSPAPAQPAFGSSAAPTQPAFGSQAPTSVPAFSFGSTSSTFGASTSQPASPAPAFSFGQSTSEPKAAAPAFSFGASSSTPAGTGFSFGNSGSTTPQSSTPAPFTFGSNAPAPSSGFGSSAAPSTGFGAPAQSSGFGQSNAGFGSAAMANTQAAPPFQFGAPASSTPTGFGSQPSAAPSAFQFGAPTGQAASPFAFGASQPATQSNPGTPTAQPGGFSFNIGAGPTEAPKSPGGRKIRRLPTRRG